MLFEDIAGYLTADESATLRSIRLRQPSDRTADPFEFSANPTNRVMLIPTFSIKFFDDLAISLAWYERYDCNKEAVFDYVAALDFSERELPAPLTALHVPDKAYTLDPYVDDVSQKTLKSALAFLVLHELGHIHYRHRHYNQIDPIQAQAQEAEADEFALTILRRMRLPPLGMVSWFMAVSMRDPLVEGSPRQTHPLTASRLRLISNDLRTNPEDFIEAANRDILTPDDIQAMANDIDLIATNLADPDLRSFVRERGRLATPELLGGACNSDQHDENWMRRFRELIE
jgi:hypothetical protein